MAGDSAPQPRERALLAAAHHDARRQIADHEARFHDALDGLPPPRSRPIEAVMFPADSIPDGVLARMCEAIELEQLSLEEVAERWDYPPSLVHRELLAFHELHRRWIVKQALAAGRG